MEHLKKIVQGIRETGEIIISPESLTYIGDYFDYKAIKGIALSGECIRGLRKRDIYFNRVNLLLRYLDLIFVRDISSLTKIELIFIVHIFNSITRVQELLVIDSIIILNLLAEDRKDPLMVSGIVKKSADYFKQRKN